ncbi:hypothetical protein AC578_5140 [Pseudocercospora eumusae]|uniref:Zinc finger PHD-type domain-containing protein n=1 Tax=Pseudocercospora eumusae TaxID=321146 RepID=A0A139HMJ1_9PEZI|nr:hypothetical protein AC578_5140 [Pseudocercospora eumusae]
MPSPPRRSTRGAAPAAPASTTSSSLSSMRQDKNSRSHTQKSATPRSQSSEDTSEPPRRSQRAQAAARDDHDPKQADAVEDGDEEAIEEDELTRCICGHQEYPGPPQSEAFADNPNAQAEDAGGLFILCDGCTVWQHGGCVGIVEESQSPEKYYCDQCKPKLHAISVDSRGQKYSLYLPLHPKANRKGSVSKSDKDAKKERASARDARESVDPSTGKRRTTMRSREHDDEDEQLRKAIEESQREAGPGSEGTIGRRNGKRGRDDSSEESKQDSKRQRRASETVPSIERTASVENDSDDGTNTAAGRTKKAKADAALLAREAERKEKDKEREKQKAEAAGRRQERARSRRNDDADAAEDTTPKPTPSAKTSPPPPSSQPPSPPPVDKVPPKKGPGKKPPKKLGNNQYTKAKYEQAASSPHGRKRQIMVSGSGDETPDGLGNGETNGNTSAGGKTSPPAENGVTTGKAKFGRGKKNAVNGNSMKPSDAEPVERTYNNMNSLLTAMSESVTREGAQLVNEMQGMVGGGVVQSNWMNNIPPEDKPLEELTALETAARFQAGVLKWKQQYGPLQREATQPETSGATS